MPYHLELGSGDNKMHERAFVVNSKTGEHKSHNPIPIERAEAQKRVLEGVDDNKKVIERESMQDNKKVIEEESKQDNKRVQEEEGKEKLKARIQQGAKTIAAREKIDLEKADEAFLVIFDRMPIIIYKEDKYKLDPHTNHLYYLNADGTLGRFGGIWHPERKTDKIDWIGKSESANDIAITIREMQRLRNKK